MMIAGSGPRSYGALVVFSYAIGPVLIIFSHACSSLLISTGINLAGLAWLAGTYCACLPLQQFITAC
jgi:hypothetical protein